MTVNRMQFTFFVLLLFSTSCNRKKEGTNPPSSPGAQDSVPGRTAPTPTVPFKNNLFYDSASGFWIDPSEINGNEYRQYPLHDNKDPAEEH